MKIFYLPDLGEGLPDAEVREWYVKEGDEIKADQPIVAMETAKAVVDVPAPRNGKIFKLHGQVGDVIKTGAPLVEFFDGEATVPKSTVVGELEVGNTVLEEAATGITPQAKTNVSIKIIPAIRAFAKKLNVDLNNVVATGANGQITAADVEQAAAKQRLLESQVLQDAANLQRSHDLKGKGFEPVRGVRRAMALTMAESHAQVVPVSIMDDADIYAWSAHTDVTLRVIRAMVVGCQTEPALNAWFDGKAMARLLHSEINLGIAMDSQEGLFVPVLKNVAQRTKKDLRQHIDNFKEQIKTRTIPTEDLKGATIMLSNVGVFAGRYASPVIVPPIVAILAVGRIREEVVPHEGKPAIHRILPLSLTIDHRAITGGEAARFLAAVIEDLQSPD
jgi:pyruvate dehydrogenase E2 component (dihydrolipoamide acetyltransferase)